MLMVGEIILLEIPKADRESCKSKEGPYRYTLRAKVLRRLLGKERSNR